MWILIPACLSLAMVVLCCAFQVGRQFGRRKIAELESGLAKANENTRLMSETAEHCSAQWQEWEKKAEGYQSFTSSVLQERDKWQRLYFEQSHQHGNAQVWMMETIGHLTRRLEALGQKVQIPPVLAELQGAFSAAHLESKDSVHTAQVIHSPVDNLGTTPPATPEPSPEKS